MMIYTISRGNQYDGQGGYRITDGVLWGWGVVGPDSRVAMGGNVSHPHGVTDAEWEQVRDAIRSTMADGVARTVQIGTPGTLHDPIITAQRGAGWCDKCQSCCYGDCDTTRRTQ